MAKAPVVKCNSTPYHRWDPEMRKLGKGTPHCLLPWDFLLFPTAPDIFTKFRFPISKVPEVGSPGGRGGGRRVFWGCGLYGHGPGPWMGS